MKTRTVLAVEDDSAIRQGIVDALQFHGYRTLEAKTGPSGLQMATQADCDIVLLDLVLPGCDGLQVLEEVRRVRPALPVIILTARGEEADRVQGLRLGADDYVVKPFGVKELLARIEAVLRRSPERPAGTRLFEIPAGTVDLARCEVRFSDGQRAELSERERDLFRHLAENPGRAVSREEILARVWRIEPSGVETRTIDMHVARLREKLRDTGPAPALILTVRGKGYMFGTLP